MGTGCQPLQSQVRPAARTRGADDSAGALWSPQGPHDGLGRAHGLQAQHANLLATQGRNQSSL